MADIETGRQVLAMDYSLGLEWEATITIGIILAVSFNRMTDTWDMQTDASLNPGNSSGPLLSMHGEILGINTRSIDRSNAGQPVEGPGFAVLVQTIYQHIERLSRRAAVFATFPRPFPRGSPRPRLSPRQRPRPSLRPRGYTRCMPCRVAQARMVTNRSADGAQRWADVPEWEKAPMMPQVITGVGQVAAQSYL